MKAFFIVAVSTLAGLFFSEWAVRKVPSIPQDLLGPLFTDDPRTVFRVKPNLKTRHKFQAAGIDATYRTNSHGFRSREINLLPSAGAERILCLGDSVTFGMGVEDDETYPVQLEGILSQNGQASDVEVLNAGQPGWGTAQQLIWLESEGLNYKPTTILLGFFLNDFQNDGMYNLYNVENGKLKAKPYVRARVSTARKITEWIPLYRTLAENSVLFNYVRRTVLVKLQYKDEKRDTAPVARVDDLDKQLAQASRVSAMELDRMRRVCDEKGIRFLVLLLVDPSTLESDEASASSDFMNTYRETKKNLRQLKIPFIDFRAEIPSSAARHNIPVDDLFIPKDQHLTKSGNYIVAEIIRDRLSKAEGRKIALQSGA